MSLKSSTKIKQQQHNEKVQATIKLVRKINFSVVVKNVTSKKKQLRIQMKTQRAPISRPRSKQI